MSFDKALKIVLKHEGGYVNHPDDPGGETNFGITKKVAEANGYFGAMKDLPLEVAGKIYFTQYWQPAKCEILPWPLSLYVFDASVNQGVGAAVKMLQKTLGTVQDGIFGVTTKRLAMESSEWHWAKYMAIRAQRYQGTRGYDTFGTGWLIRLFSVANHETK